jgi:hypothetical protein
MREQGTDVEVHHGGQRIAMHSRAVTVRLSWPLEPLYPILFLDR